MPSCLSKILYLVLLISKTDHVHARFCSSLIFFSFVHVSLQVASIPARSGRFR